MLRPVYDRTKRRDGYVSLEVSPFLAKNTEGTIKDARRLWKAVNRPNLMVKIPATVEGLPAIQQCSAKESTSISRCCLRGEIREGRARVHRRSSETGPRRAAKSSRVASVASFFISRIDSMVDAMVKAQPSSVRR